MKVKKSVLIGSTVQEVTPEQLDERMDKRTEEKLLRAFMQKGVPRVSYHTKKVFVGADANLRR